VRGAGFKAVSAGADHAHRGIVGMDSFFGHFVGTSKPFKLIVAEEE
jgi:hypothetical protein